MSPEEEIIAICRAATIEEWYPLYVGAVSRRACEVLSSSEEDPSEGASSEGLGRHDSAAYQNQSRAPTFSHYFHCAAQMVVERKSGKPRLVIQIDPPKNRNAAAEVMDAFREAMADINRRYLDVSLDGNQMGLMLAGRIDRYRFHNNMLRPTLITAPPASRRSPRTAARP